MILGPTCTDLVLTRGDLHPAQADLRPACTNLYPAQAENQPEVTSGALSHGFFHVLREVQ